MRESASRHVKGRRERDVGWIAGQNEEKEIGGGRDKEMDERIL